MTRSTANSNRPLRVLMLNRSYWPDAEATGQLLTELCEDLAPHCEVMVLAGQPNQNPEGADFVRRGWQTHHGVSIRRVAHTQFPKTSFVGRAINIVTYWLAALFAGLTIRRPDVIVVETDPPLLCLLGALLKFRHRARLIVYLQDIYPDVAVALGKLREGLLCGLLRRTFHAVYRRADRVIVLSRDMQARLRAADVPAEKLVCLPNWIDATAVVPRKTENVFRRAQQLDGRFVVMYSGNMGLSQRLENVLAAAELLTHRDDIVWLLVGGGASRARLEALAAERRLANVRFLDYQPKTQLAESLSAADLHLVVLDPRLTQLLMPSKIYGIWASGTASLILGAEHSELAELTLTHGVGALAPPDNPAALAEAVVQAASRPGELAAQGARARELAVARYDRRAASRRFFELLVQVARGAPRAAEVLAPFTEPARLSE